MLRCDLEEANENGIIGQRPRFASQLEEMPDMNPQCDTRGHLPDQQKGWKPLGVSYFAQGQQEVVVAVGGCAQPGMELSFRFLGEGSRSVEAWDVMPEQPGQPGSGAFRLKLSAPAAQRADFIWGLVKV